LNFGNDFIEGFTGRLDVLRMAVELHEGIGFLLSAVH